MMDDSFLIRALKEGHKALWKVSAGALVSVLSAGEAGGDTVEWQPAAFRSVSSERRTKALRRARLLDQLKH